MLFQMAAFPTPSTLEKFFVLLGARPRPSSSPQESSIKWLVRKFVSEARRNTLQSQEAKRAGRFLISALNKSQSPRVLRSMGGRHGSGEGRRGISRQQLVGEAGQAEVVTMVHSASLRDHLSMEGQGPMGRARRAGNLTLCLKTLVSNDDCNWFICDHVQSTGSSMSTELHTGSNTCTRGRREI